MDRFLVFALAASIGGQAHAQLQRAPEIDDEAVNKAVAAAKAASFDPEVSELIELLRTSRDRAPRLQAVKELDDRFSALSPLDQHRIIDALLWAAEDHDRAFRHWPISALGRVSEAADAATAARIAQHLGQRIQDTRIRNPFDEAGEREDMLLAYARTGSRAHPVGGRHVDQFLDGVMQEVREGANQVAGRVKTSALMALNQYMGRASHNLWFERREVLDRVADELIAIARENPFALQPRGGGQGRDPDLEFRRQFAHALLFLYAPRRVHVLISDPARRQNLKDLLERMYLDETEPSLKLYLGIPLGHRRLPY